MNNVKELINMPKNVILADAIREQIVSGKLSGSERLLSDSAFARKYGVNERTVAAGLNILVKERLLKRVPRSGTFVRENVHGKLLPPVLMLHEFPPEVLNSGHPFYLSVFNTLNTCANRNGMNFQTFDTSVDREPTTTLLENINTTLRTTLKSRNFSGLFLMEGDYNVLKHDLEIIDKPYVIFSDNEEDGSVNRVGVDYDFVIKTAFDYFKEKKCGKIGICGSVTKNNKTYNGSDMNLMVKYFGDDMDSAIAWSDGIFVTDGYYAILNIMKLAEFPADKIVCRKIAGLDVPLNCLKIEIAGTELARVAWNMMETQIKKKQNSKAVLMQPKIVV